jgi:hypothetical protein
VSQTSGRRFGQTFTIRRQARWAAQTLAILAALTVSVPAWAAGQTTFVTDPTGDALFHAPGYMDLVRAEVSKNGEEFTFQMTLAAPVPQGSPPVPPGAKAVLWVWPLNTDPTTFPAGSPFAPGNGQAAPSELGVFIFWDGSAFSGFLHDRRPLLTGGEPVVTSLPFAIAGGDLQVTTSAALLGNPSSFAWGAVTGYYSGTPFSTNGFHFVDTLEPFTSEWP